ncbi:MAG: alpha/beta hydrolase [Lachnospiraceae bacterium]|nr:alpha/beta hydrolase [Lachnospiraceae bacterium]
MRKAKRMINILVGILLCFVIILVTIYSFNQAMMAQEAHRLEEPLGEMVDMDGQQMCVYHAGSGEQTLVFLAGSGTASPILDFKPLCTRLQDAYQVVVIERFGYGFSDVVETERPFDTILRQDRQALEKVGIQGPYILCPHSMSALEAILWAQCYPEEIEAIVGLDMALPKSYEGFDWEHVKTMQQLAVVARKLGLVRFYYRDSTLSSELTEEEKQLYRAIACKKAVNPVILAESAAIVDACKTIEARPMPDIPTLLFVSDGTEVSVAHWLDIQQDYAAGLHDAEVISLDCGHYVHNHAPDRIAEEMQVFLEKKCNY